MELNKTKKIFILAGETSGDYIGSCIMNGLKQNHNDIKFFGVGGSLMETEGLSSIYNINDFNIIGFLNTIVKIKKLKKYIDEIVKFIFKEKPDIVVTVDTKGFSYALAKTLKTAFKNTEFKCPLIHFVPPTIWAYGKSRIKKWKNLHDELICLYKIEEKIFKYYDIKCTYLGNPIIEKFLNSEKKKNFKNADIFDPKKINCLLLPGSRISEINYIIPEYINLIKNSHNEIKNINWIIPTTKSKYQSIVLKFNEIKNYPIKVIILENNYDILKHANVAIACSGTITLELVLFKIPTIAVYKTDFLSSFIGRIMVNFKNVVLPNFLLGECAVPFLFQEKCDHKQMQKLLNNYIKNLEAKKKLFKNYSKNILQNMSYIDTKSTNFTYNSGKMISNLIDNYQK